MGRWLHSQRALAGVAFNFDAIAANAHAFGRQAVSGLSSKVGRLWAVRMRTEISGGGRYFFPHLNFANTLAVALFGVVAALFTELRSQPLVEYWIVELIVTIFLALFVITSYFYA